MVDVSTGGLADTGRMRTRLTAVIVMACSLLATTTAVARADPERAAPNWVTGTYVSAVPCVPTRIDLRSDHVTCKGASTWFGTLTGETVYDVDGHADPVSGGGTGTISETFYGRSTDGRLGTLHFTETFTLVPTGFPTTATLTLAAVVDDATEGFAGAHGKIDFYGTNNAVNGAGGYYGWLELPPR